MKLTVERNNLTGALQRAGRAVQRSSIPILEMVKLVAENGTLRICATNMVVWHEESLPANLDEDGALCVSHTRLSGIANGADAGSQIALHAADTQLHVNVGRARFKLSTLPPADWPQAPNIDMEESEVGAAGFLTALSRCLPCVAAADEPRKIGRASCRERV